MPSLAHPPPKKKTDAESSSKTCRRAIDFRVILNIAFEFFLGGTVVWNGVLATREKSKWPNSHTYWQENQGVFGTIYLRAYEPLMFGETRFDRFFVGMAEWPGDSFVGVTSLNTIPKRGWIHSPFRRGTGFSGVYRGCLDSQDVSFGEAEGRLLDFKKYQHGNSWKRYFCIYICIYTHIIYCILLSVIPLPSNTQQLLRIWRIGDKQPLPLLAGFRDVSQHFAWFFQISGPQIRKGFVFQLSFFSDKKVPTFGGVTLNIHRISTWLIHCVAKIFKHDDAQKIVIHFKEMPLCLGLPDVQGTGEVSWKQFDKDPQNHQGLWHCHLHIGEIKQAANVWLYVEWFLSLENMHEFFRVGVPKKSASEEVFSMCT